jgi:soluble lytic murein transglycosylase
VAGIRISAWLILLATLAGAPVAPGLGASRALAFQLAGPPVAPLTPGVYQASELARLLALAPREFDAGAGLGAAAHAAALAWARHKTPLAGADFSTLIAAAALYQKGDLAGGDVIAARIDDPLQRLALEWIALKSAPREAGMARVAGFLARHPDWPSRGWLVAFREALLYGERTRPDVIKSAFAETPPRTPAGMLALASVERQEGHAESASARVRALWRNEDLDGWLESTILRDFAPLLTGADHRARMLRLLYAERFNAALRTAALAGGDEPLLVKSWIAAAHGALTPQALNALPADVKKAPGLLYARVQGLRRADRVLEAALLMRGAPKDATALVDGDRWWDERRMIARRLLDGGLIKDAYRLCAEHVAASTVAQIDAEFHAGWIALRFLKDAATAARHFAATAALAGTPLSEARAAYWQGRAAEQANHRQEANAFYERAASYSDAYYGQLSAERLDRSVMLRPPAPAARSTARDEATRVAELLYQTKLEAFARSLAIDASRAYREDGQLSALAAVAERFADATTAVEIGKQATMRGFALDEAAFPTFGVPSFAPLAGSADLPLVYSVARQESEFITAAASGAGAKGVMQLLPETARYTAARAGVAFDPARLIADPSFNAQLGAAFLGQLLADEGGSAVLALAAYNAGGGRVQQWIEAYGDPRQPNVDLVDWVERIPFDETRDYVQRVMENWRVYRMRFGAPALPPPAPHWARADR